MADTSLDLLPRNAPSAWLRLRTLVALRWLAVGGQVAAVLVADLGFGVRVPQLACALAIGAAAALNLVATVLAAGNRRLNQREAMLTLGFDLCQLGALLWLTGGLGNPFALLIMAPVTISASVLSPRATVVLAGLAAAIITLLAGFHLPLLLDSGVELARPPVLDLGSWAALIIGTIFLAIYARRVAGETFSMSQALAATEMALAREQRLSALGGVVAAAAHELGTPLATIKLAATELVEELADQPHLQEDAMLVRAQAERCSGILRAMGPRHEADALPTRAPAISVIKEAAAPHADRGIRIVTRTSGAAGSAPDLDRRPEIVQGLRNLVQNAVDFARSTAWIDLDWDEAMLTVAIGDDGPGYPAELIGRIGDPFVRRRAGAPGARPDDQGMGLGLFIAKTLLERSGARLTFANAAAAADGPTGAIATATWPRRRPDSACS